MVKTKVLITVKTYPAISKKYDELVCTAGFREDGSWIRIYPIQFRKRSLSWRNRSSPGGKSPFPGIEMCLPGGVLAILPVKSAVLAENFTVLARV